MRQTDFSSKQLRYDSNPKAQNKKYVTDSHLMARWQLIREPTYVVNVEAQWKDNCCETKGNHRSKSDPSSIGNYVSVPAACKEQNYDGEQKYASSKD